MFAYTKIMQALSAAGGIFYCHPVLYFFWLVDMPGWCIAGGLPCSGSGGVVEDSRVRLALVVAVPVVQVDFVPVQLFQLFPALLIRLQ
jgi:hypothetical protein